MSITTMLLASLGIATVDVPNGAASFLNSHERALWSATSILADGADATADESWKSRASEPLSVKSPVPPSPLLGVVAAYYQLAKKPFALSLNGESVITTRILLLVVNLPLLAIFLLFTISCIDRVGCTRWTRFAVASATCFATMLLPLTSTLNYQLPAATATAVTLWLYLYAGDKLSLNDHLPPKLWITAGLAATLAASCQFFAWIILLPWLVLFGRLDPQETNRFLIGTGMGLAVAIGTWLVLLQQTNTAQSIAQTQATSVNLPADAEPAFKQLALGNITADSIAHDSHANNRSNPFANAFHALGGHHGLFSLTPVWLLLPVALAMSLRLEPRDFQELALVVAVITTAGVLLQTGYLLFTADNSQPNLYASGLIWMTPLWLVIMIPFIEQFEDSRRFRSFAMLLIGISILSALSAFPSISTQPWPYHLWPN